MAREVTPRRNVAPPKRGYEAIMAGRRMGVSSRPVYPGRALSQICSRCEAEPASPTYYGGPLCRSCGDHDLATFEDEGWPPCWWEPPDARHVAVLVPGALLTHAGPVRRRVASVGELGELAELCGVSQVWVHESAIAHLFGEAGSETVHPWLAGGEFRTGSASPKLSGYSRWWRPGGFGFSLHLPALEDASAFAGAEDGNQLRCWVAWYEHATGGRMTWRGGGMITSDVWLRECYRTSRRVDLGVTEHPPPVLSGAAREARFFWSRLPLPSERNMRYCHALDLNLAYAAVASSLPLPVGECVHTELPTFDKRIPGVWLIEPEPWSDETLPAPWADDYRRRREGPYWVTTPTMERCDQLGLWPIESYTWPEHHTYLRPWYDVVKAAREELLPLGGPPLEAVKQIARRGVGRLASRRRSMALETDPLYQPYWTWAIIAECRARLHRRLSALTELTGPPVAPVAIDTDAVYFLSSRASPEILAIRLGLPFGDGLGQFKVAGSCSGADARAALESGGAVSTLRRLVKA
jgi:hypothetical protein